MKNKILPALILVLFFSTKSFSQTTKAIPTRNDSSGMSQHNDLNNRKTHQAINGTKQSHVSNGASSTTYSAGKKSQAKNLTLTAKKSTKKPMYRDTRLGSSEKKYNTYKKNDNGAGAVTTSPK